MWRPDAFAIPLTQLASQPRPNCVTTQLVPESASRKLCAHWLSDGGGWASPLVISGWVEAREDQLFAIHAAIRTRLMERTWQRVPWCPPVEHRDGRGSHFRDAARGSLVWASPLFRGVCFRGESLLESDHSDWVGSQVSQERRRLRHRRHQSRSGRGCSENSMCPSKFRGSRIPARPTIHASGIRVG